MLAAAAWIAAQTQSPAPRSKPIAEFPDHVVIGILFIGFLILVVALLWSVLGWRDLKKAYDERDKQWFPAVRDLLARASKDGLSAAEINVIANTLGRGPQGVSGLTRGSIALTVATVLAVVLVLLILFGDEKDQELVETLAAGLLAAFATIIGFYFGSRTATESTQAAGELGAGEALAAAGQKGPARGGEGDLETAEDDPPVAADTSPEATAEAGMSHEVSELPASGADVELEEEDER